MDMKETTLPVPSRARGNPKVGYGNGVGQGDGWGGPAKGADPARKPKSTAAALVPGCDTAKRQDAAVRRERKDIVSEEMFAKLVHLARHAEREETQLAAASKLLDRIEGLPVARQIITDETDISRMTDEELHVEIARLEELNYQSSIGR